MPGAGDHHLDDVLNFLHRRLDALEGAQLDGVDDHAGDAERVGVVHQAQAVVLGLVVPVRIVGALVPIGVERERDGPHDSLRIPICRASVPLPHCLVSG